MWKKVLRKETSTPQYIFIKQLSIKDYNTEEKKIDNVRNFEVIKNNKKEREGEGENVQLDNEEGIPDTTDKN